MKCNPVALWAIAGTLAWASPLSAQVQGQWTLTGPMQSPREAKGQALLANGDVLTVGGTDSSGNILGSAEIWSHAKSAWTLTTGMQAARESFPAVRLADGKVLVVGGLGTGGTVVGAAELFDPKSNTWSPAGTLSVPRYAHTATVLPSGRVLVTGGCTVSGCGAITTSSEIYNPKTNHWLPAGSLNTARAFHSAVLLDNGSVLVVGGGDSSTELYDPSTAAWSYAASTSQTHYLGATTLLPDGKVLVTGGKNGKYPMSSAEIYDPAANVWSPAGNMTAGRYGQSSTLLADGTVVVAGGVSKPISCGKLCVGYIPTATTELYDETTNTFTGAPALTRALAYHASTALADGRALVNGGEGYGTYCCQVVADSEFYTPLTMTFSSSSLNFGYLQIGLTSPSQAVTVTNVSGHSVAVSSIASSGDFAQTNTCLPSLASGQTCTITITFKPTASGARKGAVTLKDDAPGSPVQTIALAGIGKSLALAFSPAKLDFGSIVPGTTSVLSATLLNDGASAVDITGVIISPTNKTFTQTNNCPGTLPVQQTCTFQITFKPPDIFKYKATLSVSNSAGAAAALALTGQGLNN